MQQQAELTIVVIHLSKAPTALIKMKIFAELGSRLAGWSAVAAFFTVSSISNVASACSLVDARTAISDSVIKSSYYWIASVVLGTIIAGIVIYYRRWLWSPIVVTILLIFHPTWTVTPSFGPDCSFQNVEASQWVLTLIGLLLAYQLFSIWRWSSEVSSQSKRS